MKLLMTHLNRKAWKRCIRSAHKKRKGVCIVWLYTTQLKQKLYRAPTYGVLRIHCLSWEKGESLNGLAISCRNGMLYCTEVYPQIYPFWLYHSVLCFQNLTSTDLTWPLNPSKLNNKKIAKESVLEGIWRLCEKTEYIPLHQPTSYTYGIFVHYIVTASFTRVHN